MALILKSESNMRAGIFTLFFCLLSIVKSEAQYFFLSPKIVHSNYIGTTPQQGTSVELSGDGNTMMIGATLDSANRGSVYVYNKINSAWVYDTTLIPNGWTTTWPFSSSFYYYGFGSDIAMSHDGNTAIIGRCGDSDMGAIWIYERDGNGVWHDMSGRKTMPPPYQSAYSGARFGQAIDITADGKTAIIGAPGYNSLNGATFMLKKNTSGAWSLYSFDYGNGNSGSAVAIAANGNRIAIGEPTYDHIKIYDYNSSNGGYDYKGYLPYTPASAVGFGGSFDISYSGDTIVVGALDYGVYYPGAVVLAKTATTWAQVGTDIKVQNSASIGMRVALSADGRKLAMSMPYENNSKGGASYSELNAAGNWTTPTRLFAGGTIGQAQQGGSLAFSADGSTMAVGGHNDNSMIGATWVHTKGAPQLSTSAISGSPFCPQTSMNITVPFTANIVGGAYRAELSDRNGDFLNAQLIGTGTTSPLHGTLTATQMKGSGYRVRVVYTGDGNLNQGFIGDTSVTTLEINTCFPQSVTGVAAASLNVYPNPVGNNLHIDNLQQTANYSIFSATGAIVKSGVLTANTATLEMNVPDGLYFVELENKTDHTTIKVLVKH